jgi:hypothetical protein
MRSSGWAHGWSQLIRGIRWLKSNVAKSNITWSKVNYLKCVKKERY